jgi:hypothetical protein
MINVWKASTLVLAGALALVVGRNAVVSDVAAEPQPLMVKAIERLEEAKVILERATPDKGGHRVKAIAAAKLAIEETREGIKYDNDHKDDKAREAPPPAAPPPSNDSPDKPHTKRLENPK